MSLGKSSFHFFRHCYLFLAMLGLCCCEWAFSSCDKRGLLLAVVRGFLTAVPSLVQSMGSRCRGFSRCSTRAQDLRLAGSVLWRMGSAALRRVGSSRTRDGALVPSLAGGFLPTMPPGKLHGTFSFPPAPESKVSLLMNTSCPQTFCR